MNERTKILAVASGGGHWVQLLRLMPAFQDCEVIFVSTLPVASQTLTYKYYRIVDGNRWNKLRLLFGAMQILLILISQRPDVIITTGAAPGYLAIRFGKMLGCRTIWVDSFANVDELSLSGKMAGKYADLWLTQWPHLAAEAGPHYFGAVI